MQQCQVVIHEHPSPHTHTAQLTLSFTFLPCPKKMEGKKGEEGLMRDRLYIVETFSNLYFRRV